MIDEKTKFMSHLKVAISEQVALTLEEMQNDRENNN